MKLSSRLVLTIAVMALAGACRPGGKQTRYPEAPTAAAGDAAAEAGREIAPVDGSWPRSGAQLLEAAGDGRVAGLLFDLKGVAGDALKGRVVLRMRRRRARGLPTIWVMDVKKGLRVKLYTDGEPVWGIRRASLTADKRAIAAAATEETEGRELSGLALGAYPVECSLRGAKYTPKFLGSGKRYARFLEEWNPPRRLPHTLRGAWDEIEVSGPVRAAAAADGLVLLAVAAKDGDVDWFGPRKGREWAAPRLVIRKGAGAEPVEPTPGPKPPAEPAPKPTPKPKPKPKPEPPVAGRGRLMVSSKPERADLYVGGKYVGTTPSRELNLPAGPVKVRIEKKGHKTWERTVTVLKDNTVSVAPELEKE